MRRLYSYLFIAVLSWAALNVFASKANGQPFHYTQPDGTTVTVVLHGDEHFSWSTTTDGILLFRSGSHFFIADVDESGTLRPTTFIAHNNGQRSNAEVAAANRQHRKAFHEVASRELSRAARKSESLGKTDYVPHVGSPTFIVLLVEFADVRFTLLNPQESFSQLFNSEEELQDLGNGENNNHGSVRKYFTDMSDGLFKPHFQVLAPVTLPNDMKHYGGTSSSANDEKPMEVIKDALALIEEDFDFDRPEYDHDNNGKVDGLCVIYAGYGQNNGGPVESLWARSSSVSATTSAGKAFSRYAMSSELNFYEEYWTARETKPQIAGVGIICHEFSHAMGLPDIYPTSSSAQVDNQEMEYWDLMDGGEYVRNGYRPTAYTGWEREVMGWRQIQRLDNTQEGIAAKPLLDGGTAYRISNPDKATEYFVLENVQKISWNTSLPGHGLLVYHVNYPSATVSVGDKPNNTAGKPGMAVVPADGILASSYQIGKETPWGTGEKKDSEGNIISSHIATSSDYHYSHRGDPFPGTSEVHELTYAQGLPNFLWHSNGSDPQKALYDIVEDETTGIVTFQYSHDGLRSAIRTIETETDANNVYTLDGRKVAAGASLPKGIYIIGKQKHIIK